MTINEIWVFADFDNQDNLGLLGKARLLADACNGQTAAVCLAGINNEDHLFQYGADILYRVHSLDNEFSKSKALYSLCEAYHPEILLFPSTIEYNAIAAYAAAKLETGLSADCTDLSIDDDGLLRQTRSVFGGALVADIYCPKKRPQMATVKSGNFPVPIPDLRRTGIYKDFIPQLQSPELTQLMTSEQKSPQSDFRDTRIIVAGGKGIGSREGFNLLEKVANRIGGIVGASRSAVDAGYADFSSQIGQSGKSVSPALYIAFAISGAPQHIAGMRTSGKVIAVNSDPMAPIFDYADLAIVNDWRETVNELLEIL